MREPYNPCPDDRDKPEAVIVYIVAMFLVALLILGLGIFVVRPAGAEPLSETIGETANTVVEKVTEPTSWLEDQSIKLGLVTSFCAAQSLTGLIESAKFGGVHISNNADNYHAFRVAQNAAWASTGFFSYAVTQQDKPWWAKGCRVLGAACHGRNAMEMTARWNLYGSPWDYRDTSWNRKAVVYWDLTDLSFPDLYISGVGKQGAAIDIGFAAAGVLFGIIGNAR